MASMSYLLYADELDNITAIIGKIDPSNPYLVMSVVQGALAYCTTRITSFKQRKRIKEGMCELGRYNLPVTNN